jgi:hypothetical protein
MYCVYVLFTFWQAIKEDGQAALGLRPLQRVHRLQGLRL